MPVQPSACIPERACSKQLTARRLFKEFSAQPIAAASLGQVHKAVLWDGRTVAVKVQRPGLKGLFDIDLAALRQIAAALDAQDATRDFVSIYGECAEVLYQEIDYVQEARPRPSMPPSLDPRLVLTCEEPSSDLSVPAALQSHPKRSPHPVLHICRGATLAVQQQRCGNSCTGHAGNPVAGPGMGARRCGGVCTRREAQHPCAHACTMRAVLHT